MNKSILNNPDSQHLSDVFTHNLNRMYFGKRYLDEKMPALIDRASFKALKLALTEMHQDVRNQISRMEEMYLLIHEKQVDESSNPIKSILKDEFCLSNPVKLPVLNDMDILLYVQILEHINITAYRLMKLIAPILNRAEIEQLLTECFDESVEDDQLFVLITKEHINTRKK